ncbi:MAG: prolyl-tRNA synthetase associated domain-containing protein [Pseudomonadota bacterium]
MSETDEQTQPSAAIPRGFDLLAEAFFALKIDPPTVEHEAAFTVDDARELRGTIPGLHTKNLFLKDKKGALFLVTAPEDADIDLKTIHTLIGGRGRVSFGSAELMATYLGIAPGSVTPLALINDQGNAVKCVLHPSVAVAPLVNVHPLRNTATATLTGAELQAFLNHIGHAPLVIYQPS